MLDALEVLTEGAGDGDALRPGGVLVIDRLRFFPPPRQGNPNSTVACDVISNPYVPSANVTWRLMTSGPSDETRRYLALTRAGHVIQSLTTVTVSVAVPSDLIETAKDQTILLQVRARPTMGKSVVSLDSVTGNAL